MTDNPKLPDVNELAGEQLCRSYSLNNALVKRTK